jgi:ABC-type sugar transport system ATPase subunit
MSPKETAVLEARGITKQYPGTKALDNVDFQLYRGQITALIGENGAGKSTLVKILSGVEQPTSGTMLLDGEPIRIRSVRDADAHGIGMIHQELNLCPNLSVAENIFLARELTQHGVLDRSGQEQRARELMTLLAHDIDVTMPAGELPLGQQQIIEIARALERNVRILMMDEPTSALSAAEITVLFRVMRDLKARGVAIVYISHRLEELLEIADSVSVMRDGRLVAAAPVNEIDTKWIVERMTGRPVDASHAQPEAANGQQLLRGESLSLPATSGRAVLRDVSLHVDSGEVLGIYGLMGSGRTELLESLMGLHPEMNGSIWLDSKKLTHLSVTQRIDSGLAMVPEDRQTSGLVQCLTVKQNMTLASLQKFVRAFWLSAPLERNGAAGMLNDLRIKAPGPDHNIGALSGGNQQKVVIARCLLTSPRVLLMDEPTRGVDVGAKQEIYGIVRRLTASGMGVVFVSSELDEVRSVANRILVMSRGSVTGEFSGAAATSDALARAASGRSYMQGGELN